MAGAACPAGHLRVVERPQERAGRRARTDARQQALQRATLASRIRGSLDGLGIADVETEILRLQQQRDAGDGAAGERTGDEDIALHAHQQVLAWMLDNDECVYHGQLR